MSRRGRQDPESDEDGVDEDSPAKRQRSGAPAVYPKGTVKQVKVCNFMTYGEPAVTIKPGARLNLVLGPNGTGKSSLVCALCVGLGGSTNLLGRAVKFQDFIRRGCDKGWVETTLSGGPGRPDHVIRCDMSNTNGYKSDWRINGVTSGKAKVQALVKLLNIQFDNLCQFLPQDKVVEFAQMDQYQLLVATEKAIGDASLYKTHQRLNQKRELVKERQNAADASAARHEHLVAQNQTLERDYERFRRRKNLQERVVLMKKKHAWMGVRELQEKAKAANEEAKQAQQAFNVAQADANHDERPLKQRQQEAERARKAAGELQQAVRAKDQEMKKAADKLGKEEDAVREARTKLQGLQKEKDDLEASKEDLRAKIAKLQAAHDNLPPVPDYTAEMQQLQEQLHSLNEQLGALEGDKTHLMHERGAIVRKQTHITEQLRECDSVAGQRLNALMRLPSTQGLLDAYRWVQQQKAAGAFRGEVIGPLGLEMKVKRGPHAERLAQNLEQATWSQLINFACEYPEDEKLLMDTLKQQNVRSNVVTIRPGAATPTGDAARYKDYGVLCTLDEVYDAPPLVKKVLANTCGLHRTYCVTHDDTDVVKRLMEDHGVRNVFTTQALTSYIASSYGGKEDAALMSKVLFPLRVLGNVAGVDDERKQQLQGQLAQVQQKLAQLDQQVAAKAQQEGPLNQQVEDLHAQKQQLQAEVAAAKAKKTKLQNVLKQATIQLGKTEQKPDPLKEAPALKRKIEKALAMHHGVLTAQIEAVMAAWELLQQQVVSDMAWRELEMQARAMQLALDARKVELRRLQQAAKAAAIAANSAKETYLRAKEEAEADHPLDAEARKRFEQMPDDREELQEKIAELEVEVAGIAVNNPRVVEEYLKRKAEIEKLAQDLAAQRAELDSLHTEIEQLKEDWLPKLQEVVGQINTSFAANFAQIGCAGEVLLSQHEDYDKFSMQIKVKFREHEDLQLLTAHRQSGGERSVSTILYLIALQGVTVTPFRVVDEINQGMDPVNERKVFKQLVEASCHEGTPQCFLLTPKLLPDLHYTEDITILNIFNGGLIADQVAGQYDRKQLFGAAALEQLQQGVPVAG